MGRDIVAGTLFACAAICAAGGVAAAQAQSASNPAAAASRPTDSDEPRRLPLERPPQPAPEALPASGSADSRGLAPRFGILGNLGGLRDVLWEHGVLLNLDYNYQAATNLQGGIRGPLLRGAGQFAVRGLFDFDRMLGVEGGTGVVTLTHREGRDLTVDAGLGTQTSVEEVYGRGRIWRLSQFWYNQRFEPGIDLKVGRMPIGEDFAGFACEFQLLALCGSQPGKISGGYWYNFPVSQWATRLRVGIPDVAYVQVGAFQVNPDNLVDGFSFDLGKGTGALVVSEAGWSPRFGTLGLVGSYKVGGWYETGGGNDVLLNQDALPRALFGGTPLHRQDRHGFYLVGIQEIYRPDPENRRRNLSAFVRCVYGDEATSAYSAQETAGLVYKGFWEARPDDWVGLGVGRTVANPRLAESLALVNAVSGQAKAIPTQERFLEAFYSIAVNADVVIRPNLQYIHRPSGTDLKRDVVVLGVKSAINF